MKSVFKSPFKFNYFRITCIFERLLFHEKKSELQKLGENKWFSNVIYLMKSGVINSNSGS